MYKQNLNQKEIQKAIKFIKVYYETELSKRLNLTRVSAPLFVTRNSGLNDYLNEIERPVTFDALNIPEAGNLEIVQSLAKWKRAALKKYGFTVDEGLYTNMNAIRRDEVPDEVHSLYVDQWDFEKVMDPKDRTIDYLKNEVEKIYSIFIDLEKILAEKYDYIKAILPEKIKFITTEELRAMYPTHTPKQRERLITKEFTAVFLINIGNKLSDGTIHDGRAPDYDDWNLNGDLLFYNSVLDDSIELSSMGIRVNKDRLLQQLEERNLMHKTKFPFHKMLLDDELPQTFGGGIGQSRMCQYLLRCYHIGEVQCSLWTNEILEEMESKNIKLL